MKVFTVLETETGFWLEAPSGEPLPCFCLHRGPIDNLASACNRLLTDREPPRLDEADEPTELEGE